MTSPIALCLENVEGPDDESRFIRCVALEGRGAGLAIDPQGRPLWVETRGCACELCVASDGVLVLLRPVGAVASRVHRAGRSVIAPENGPVVLLDQDEIEVGNARLRLHVHGQAVEVHPPTPLRLPPRSRSVALAAAVALAAPALGCDRDGSTDSGSTIVSADTAAVTAAASSSASTQAEGGAPGAPTETASASPNAPAADAGAPTATVTTSASAKPPTTAKQPPIEIRHRPPVADPVDRNDRF